MLIEKLGLEESSQKQPSNQEQNSMVRIAQTIVQKLRQLDLCAKYGFIWDVHKTKKQKSRGIDIDWRYDRNYDSDNESPPNPLIDYAQLNIPSLTPGKKKRKKKKKTRIHRVTIPSTERGSRKFIEIHRKDTPQHVIQSSYNYRQNVQQTSTGGKRTLE
jgi:hypothetical protein